MRRLACGIDIVEIERIGKALEVAGDAFVREVYTEDERAKCAGNVVRFAELFAAKEAALKALGTGIRGVALSEIEVKADPSGKYRIRLLGSARELADAAGLSSWAADVGRSRSQVVAVAIATGD